MEENLKIKIFYGASSYKTIIFVANML